MDVANTAAVDNRRFRKGKANTGLVEKMSGGNIARVIGNKGARD